MSVGEVLLWGESTGGDAKSIEDFRSYRISKVSGNFKAAAVLYEGTAGDLLGKPIGEEELEGIKDIAVGTDHTLALTVDGKVLACGKGDMGQLGLGAKITGAKSFIALAGLAGREIVEISCGANHSAAVSSSGDIYTWGSGLQGQTGLASPSLDEKTNAAITGVQLLPKLISSFVGKHKIRSAACGEAHTACVTESGQVWCWGEGRCGQLGYGKVRKQALPKRTLEKCLDESKGAPFIQVACGWAHTIARTKLGDVYVWGFNAYGQLGLGHAEAQFYPQKVSVVGLNGEACRVSDIAACGNYSACRSERKDLYTWGCGGHGRLGHGSNENVYTPALVECLQGKQAAGMALTANDMFVFVPSIVYMVEPPCGPITGGTKIMVHGGGFWDMDGIVIKFEPEDKAENPTIMARSSVASYAKDANPAEGIMQQLTCRTPRFSDAVSASVEVAMNGSDFTESGVIFQYYESPVIESVNPLSLSAQSSKEVKIKGMGFFETDRILVRFKEKGHENREMTVKGWIVKEVVGTFENPETEEMEDIVERYVVCKSPMFQGNFPMEARLSVALNGIDFVFLQGMNIVIHNAATHSAVPSSGPTTGGTKIHVMGSSFYAAPTVRARILVPARGVHYSLPNIPELDSNDDVELPSVFQLSVPVTVHTKEKLSFVVPNSGFFSEMLGGTNAGVKGIAEDKETGEEADVQDADEMPEDAGEEAETEPKITSSKTLLQLFPENILAVNCKLEVTVDGEEYLEKPIDINFYRPGIEFSLQPAAGPVVGDTEVTLLVDGVLFEGSDAKVKFNAASEGAGLLGGIDVDTDALVETDGTSSSIRCKSLAMSEALEELAAKAAPEPVEAAEEEDEAGSTSAIEPIQTAQIPVKLSLNGIDWLAYTTPFLVYTNPVVAVGVPEVGVYGKETELQFKAQLQIDCVPKVKVRTEANEIVEVEATSKESGISFAMPQLEIPDNYLGENEGDADEDTERVIPTSMPIYIDVAMNGINYTGTEFAYAYALPGGEV